MSIASPSFAAAAGRTGAAEAVALLVLAAFSIAIAIAARAIPPRRMGGGLRVPPGRPAWPLAVVLLGAVSIYVLSGSLIFSIARGPGSTTRPATAPASGELELTALVSTIPPLLALAALLLGDSAVRDLTGHDLGIAPRNLPRAILPGLLGVFIVFPPLVVLAIGFEALYRLVHYTHEAEHPLLKVLSERPPTWVTALIIIGATVIAPLFEELLFRGHIQTLLQRLFYTLSTRPAPPAAFPVIADSPEFSPPLAAEPIPKPRARAWQTWAAIVITAALFASVHPGWTRPIIFVLALCLGYAYERTGNLWVSIIIHALFNSISTALFLAGLDAR
jgi:membrane protease YdiL (CAAX protease family)